MMNKGDLCLVTGVSGYLASWLAKDLLDQGYRVRGTVRDLRDERIPVLRTLLPGVELVAADLRREANWDAGVAGCQWIFHVASPQAVKSEHDRTGGAVAGTQHLLAAAFAESAVRKIVVTGSVAAVAYGHPRSKRDFSEDDWTDLDGIGAGAGSDYFRSKTLAERLAWQWAGDAQRNPRRVPLATVNPGLILGPSLVPWGRFSLDTLRDIALGKSPLMVDMDLATVDVRDCAQMHIAVMNDEASAGRRHLSIGITGKFVDLARIVRRDFAPVGFRPSIRLAPQWFIWLLSRVSSEVASIYSHIGNSIRYQPRHPEIYAYRHRSLDALVRDTMDSLFVHGWLTPKRTTVRDAA